MSRKVFEYFFDPDDLEPFYSELPQSLVEPKSKRENRASDTVERVTDRTELTQRQPAGSNGSADNDHKQRARPVESNPPTNRRRNRMPSRLQSRHRKRPQVTTSPSTANRPNRQRPRLNPVARVSGD